MKELENLEERDRDSGRRFFNSHLIHQWSGLSNVNRKTANDAQREWFLKEWWETLQIIRNISQEVSKDENRPSWIRSNTPAGAQADQFLHAHYYGRTFDGRKANYEKYYNENKSDPDAALREAIQWWQALSEPPGSEARILNEWAPFLKNALAESNILRLSASQLKDVCQRVHAIQDHARRVPNHVLGLPAGRQYPMEEKTEALADYLYERRSAGGESVLDTLCLGRTGRMGITRGLSTSKWENKQSSSVAWL